MSPAMIASICTVASNQCITRDGSSTASLAPEIRTLADVADTDIIAGQCRIARDLTFQLCRFLRTRPADPPLLLAPGQMSLNLRYGLAAHRFACHKQIVGAGRVENHCTARPETVVSEVERIFVLLRRHGRDRQQYHDRLV